MVDAQAHHIFEIGFEVDFVILSNLHQLQDVLHVGSELLRVLLAPALDVFDHELLGGVRRVLREDLLLDALVEQIHLLLRLLETLDQHLLVVLHHPGAVEVAAVDEGNHLVEGGVVFSLLRLGVHFTQEDLQRDNLMALVLFGLADAADEAVLVALRVHAHHVEKLAAVRAATVALQVADAVHWDWLFHLDRFLSVSDLIIIKRIGSKFGALEDIWIRMCWVITQ